MQTLPIAAMLMACVVAPAFGGTVISNQASAEPAASQITGALIGSGSEPIAGVTISAVPLEGSTHDTISVLTDANGAFQLDVFIGAWQIDVKCFETDGLKAKGYNCVGGQSTTVSTTNGTTVNFVATPRVPLVITTTNLIIGTESAPYSAPLNASGGIGGYTWEIAPVSEPLPAGLTFSSDEINASISGFPTTNGNFAVVIRVTDGDQTVTEETLSLVINPAASQLRGRVTDDLGAALANLSIEAGTESGVISRATDQEGNFAFNVNAGSWTIYFNETSVASMNLVNTHLTTEVTNGVDQEDITIVLPRATSAIVGVTRHDTGTAAEGPGVPDMLVKATSFINGRNYSSSGMSDSSGNFSLPVINGDWTVTLDEVQLNDYGFKPVDPLVRTLPPSNPAIFILSPVFPAVRTLALPPGTVNEAYSRQLQVLGGEAPYSWSVASGELPPGLSLSSSGLLSGTTTTAGIYSFALLVSDANENVGDREFTITVAGDLPVIITHPQGDAVFPDANVTFNVTALGAAPLRYQWLFRGTPIAGATTSSYQIVSAQAINQGTYSVVVSNSFGSITSSNAVLRINRAPTITAQPAHVTVYAGTNATFSVTATGTAVLAYQWRFQDQPIDGATAASLSIAGTQTNQAGLYSVVVSNEFGVVQSSNANLTVNLPVSIHASPGSAARRAGSDIAFAVQASGTPPLTYQWRFKGVHIPGATNSALVLEDLTSEQTGNYRVIVGNGGGSVTSPVAFLEVYDCAYALSTHLLTLDFNAQNTFVNVATSNDCPWTVVNTNTWITLSSSNGIGSSGIEITVDFNTNAAPRIGHIQIAGLPFRLVQLGTPGPLVLAGKTVRFSVDDASGVFPGYGSYLLVTRRGTNTYRMIQLPVPASPLPPNIAAEIGTYSYFKSGVTAVVTVGAVEIQMTFQGAMHGSFTANDTFNPDNSQTGQFVIFDTKPDFHEDGWTDIPLQKNTGQIAVWRMQGLAWESTASLREGRALPPGWRAVSQYDFDADGHVDLLLQHDSGKTGIWYLDGQGNWIRNGPVGDNKTAASGWRIFSTADMDNDHEADILLQHDNGRVAAWLMDGSSFVRAIMLRDGQPAAAGWRAVAANDLNHDGQNDILFQHTDRRMSVWEFAGPTFLRARLLKGGGTPGNRAAAGMADFNLDGQLDILLHSPDGRFAVWLLNNGEFESSASIAEGKMLNTAWFPIGPR